MDPIPVWLWIVGAGVALFLILPTLVVIPSSFSTTSAFKFPPEGFTLRWYTNFFTNPIWLTSLGNSFLVAVSAAALATIVGTAAAVGLNRMTGRAASFLRTLLMVSMVTPSIVIAVAVYISFLKWHLTGSLPGYVLAHAALGVPFVLVAVTSALGGFDPQLLRAAASLGASPIRSFLTVTMPLISRGILSGAVFAFATSFDEVVIALFLRSPTFQTLPVQMYNSVTFELDPTISAASSLIVVAVTVLFLVPQLMGNRKKTD
ncbi:ABC transporter permease [Arthrobacter sp. zg-Y20]|uniref:ABC transporter permease n=1 Tax=unclassified Arthrobacter TaxID=235627 RepID=UPI001D1475ED|nr:MULTISPECIES: ABC transporter permease [unclassified Arthrobacter]MCC3274542.1 ABC transporter permease [Arthrobacter sp. zg-Y20]MCC9177868.1 ABC transporter permease [Arthrobacter sp. zg-Y750]MDK1314699.1 ABC transporter permease [Arthrobacter sp. zg.Y20]WIB07678.1 ABC transporter permease [Arthrobacter sp. zg-Y20]